MYIPVSESDFNKTIEAVQRIAAETKKPYSLSIGTRESESDNNIFFLYKSIYRYMYGPAAKIVDFPPNIEQIIGYKKEQLKKSDNIIANATYWIREELKNIAYHARMLEVITLDFAKGTYDSTKS